MSFKKVEGKSHLTGSVFSIRNKVYRAVCQLISILFIRYSPSPMFSYRRSLLRLLGGDLHPESRIYPSAKIWAPVNLKIGRHSTIGPRVNLYNQGEVLIGSEVIISQDSTLCASTHDYRDPLHPLVLAPIKIEDHAWICAEAFVGPGVTVGEGAVVGARAVLTKDAEPWSVYAGNPAKKVNERKPFDEV